MGKQENVKVVLDVFAAIERRDDQRFRELRTSGGPAATAPTWSETWIPLQPTEADEGWPPASWLPARTRS